MVILKATIYSPLQQPYICTRICCDGRILQSDSIVNLSQVFNELRGIGRKDIVQLAGVTEFHEEAA